MALYSSDVDKEDQDAVYTLAGTLVVGAFLVYALDRLGFRFVIGVGG